MSEYDAIVVGAGPNGLSAALTLARSGLRVLVREGAPRIGGGTRTEALTLPGFLHDVCAAVLPMGVLSPFFRSVPLEQYGVEWVHSPVPLAHVLGDRAVMLEHSVEATAEGLDADGPAWRRLLQPLLDAWDALSREILRPIGWPRHPWLMARFGLRALRSAESIACSRFRTAGARALFAGLAAHAAVPLSHSASAAIGLVLAASAHRAGWPMVRGGTARVADALARALLEAGGRIETDAPVDSLDDIPGTRAILLDVTPPAAARLAAGRLPAGYAERLKRYRFGPGAFKLDWALSGPIPWRAAECRRAATVHIGGTFEEIARGEQAAWDGRVPEEPFVLLAQPSLFDDTRAPPGQHTAWAYCHVPNGSTVDMTERIEQRIEAFAPGFRDLILARSVRSPLDLERYNPNLVGGDVGAGANDLRQLLFRPVPGRHPYRTPARGIYLCSAATSPGGGVHGMCGWNAAQVVLRDLGRRP